MIAPKKSGVHWRFWTLKAKVSAGRQKEIPLGWVESTAHLEVNTNGQQMAALDCRRFAGDLTLARKGTSRLATHLYLILPPLQAQGETQRGPTGAVVLVAVVRAVQETVAPLAVQHAGLAVGAPGPVDAVQRPSSG